VAAGANRLRQELVILFRETDGPKNLPGILQQVALEALSRDQAYSVGDVLGPRDELQSGSTLSAFYLGLPVYFPDSFQVARTPGSEPVVFGWLVPITKSEAALVASKGREALEDAFVKADPDLLDFSRTSVVLNGL
jgi:hypothetical protein